MANRNKSATKNMQSPYRRWVRVLKRIYYRFLRIRGTPRQISLGLALGFFIGMTPFLGFHTVIAVMLAAVFKWSKIAAGAGVFITNPFTAPLIYPLTYKLGSTVTGFSNPPQWHQLFESGGVVNLVKNSPMILVDLTFGGMIIGLPLAVIVYYVAFHTVSRAKKRMELRKARRITKRAALLKRKSLREAKKKADQAKREDALGRQ